MRVGKKHRVDPSNVVLESLVPEVRARVDKDDPTVIERKTRGGSVSMVSRVL